jgi:hypothetical protein
MVTQEAPTADEIDIYWESVLFKLGHANIAIRMRNEAMLDLNEPQVRLFSSIANEHFAVAQRLARKAPRGWADIGRRLEDVAKRIRSSVSATTWNNLGGAHRYGPRSRLRP